ATMAGLLGAVTMIVGAIVLGGAPKSFIDLPSVLIVLGGTLAVTTMSFSIAEVSRAQQAMLRALVRRPADPAAAAEQMLGLAEIARLRGPMQLQNRIGELRGQPFLQRALLIVIDGAPPEEVERTMVS